MSRATTNIYIRSKSLLLLYLNLFNIESLGLYILDYF